MKQSGEKKIKHSGLLTQMCELLNEMISLTDDQKLLKELEGMKRSIQSIEPIGGFEIKRAERQILVRLKEVKDMVSTAHPVDKILGQTAEIGLLILERVARAKRK